MKNLFKHKNITVVRILTLVMTLVVSFTTVTFAWYTANGTLFTDPANIGTQEVPDVLIEINLENNPIDQPYDVYLDRLNAAIPETEGGILQTDNWYVPTPNGRQIAETSPCFFEEVWMNITSADPTKTVQFPYPIYCKAFVRFAEDSPINDPTILEHVEFAAYDKTQRAFIVNSAYGYGTAGQEATAKNGASADTAETYEFASTMTPILFAVWLDGSAYSADLLNAKVIVEIRFTPTAGMATESALPGTSSERVSASPTSGE